MYTSKILQAQINTTLKYGLCYSSSLYQEIRIPVPWGYVAAKWWGPQNKRPLLALHGWQDNSGTFDTLIPLLSKQTSFLAVDLPGCGYSSKLPDGVFYHVVDLVVFIRRIVKYFNWPKVSLLSHSMSAAVSYVYTMHYSDEVDLLISLDTMTPLLKTELQERFGGDVDDLLRLDYFNSTKEEPPSYSLQDMEYKLHKTLNSIELDKCKYILERNIKPSSKDVNKFYFTVDARLKFFNLVKFDPQTVILNATRLSCPVLFCRANKSPLYEIEKYFLEVIDILKQSNKNFEMHLVEGTHHAHLNNPEELERPLNEFLAKHDVGDRSESGLREENIVC